MTINFDGLQNDSLIFDFETLSVNSSTGAALSVGAITFDGSRFASNNPYEYEELIDDSKTFKFDVGEQVEKFGRTISKETLAWWADQGPEARKALNASPKDRPLKELHGWFVDDVIKGAKLERVYTRGNTFDPIFLSSLLEAVGEKVPYEWWAIRDTRSIIDGLAWGNDISNKYIPDGLEEKFVAHVASHDCAMDIMRMQTLVRALNGDD